MSVRVGINGFGRIGRNFVRAAIEGGADLDVVAVNDLTSPDVNAHLLAYDSTQGRLPAEVRVEGGDILVGGRTIKVLSEREPKALPWADLGVEVVVESTGRFRDREAAAAHLEAGARRVVISAPGKGVDATFVVGVNDDTFVPMVQVLDQAFGVRQGMMTTAHAYTNDQNLLDLTHSDLRRARAAAINIVPSSTGAARATGLVLQAMQGRLDGVALRVPVACGSVTDFTAVVGTEVDVAGVNAAFAQAASSGPLARVLEYSEEPLVSSDIVGSPASCVFDSQLTMAMPMGEGATLVKVFGWYDNEWGYSNRLVDLVALVGRA